MHHLHVVNRSCRAPLLPWQGLFVTGGLLVTDNEPEGFRWEAGDEVGGMLSQARPIREALHGAATSFAPALHTAPGVCGVVETACLPHTPASCHCCRGITYSIDRPDVAAR